MPDLEEYYRRFDDFHSVTLSTGPASPPTHWMQTVVMMPNAAIDLEVDEVIGWEVKLTEGKIADNKQNHAIDVTLLDPLAERHPEYCDCGLAKCALIQEVVDEYTERTDYDPWVEKELLAEFLMLFCNTHIVLPLRKNEIRPTTHLYNMFLFNKRP